MPQTSSSSSTSTGATASTSTGTSTGTSINAYAAAAVNEPRLAAARRVADAILFEGYILYPYRPTSAKNQLCWRFGMLGPVGAARAGVGEEPGMRTTLLVEPRATVTLDLILRFLHPQFRTVERAVGAGFEPVDELSLPDARWAPWHEAVACELPLSGITSDTDIPIEVGGGEDVEPLHDGDQTVGRLVRTRQPLRGRVRVRMRPLDAAAPLLAVDVDLQNLGRWDRSGVDDHPRTAARDLAARGSFAGAHAVARVRGGRFLSLTAPPPWAAEAAAHANQYRCWPVLLGAEGGPDDLALISPIVLPDRPELTPES